MNRQRILKRSLFVLALMSIAIFAMAITASAATGVKGIKQTDADDDSVTIEWTSNYGEEYIVCVASSKNGTYVNASSYSSSSNEKTLYDLQAGRAYYVKIKTVNDDNKTIAISSAFQVVTAPKSVDSDTILQTSASKSRIYFKWTKASGATGYIVGKEGGKTKTVTKTSTYLSASVGGEYYVQVTPYKKSTSGYIAKGSTTTGGRMYGQTKVPTNVAKASKDYLDWNSSENSEITVKWDGYWFDCDGYQLQMFTVDGKKKIAGVKVAKSTTESYTFTTKKVIKAVKNKGFKIRIRAYRVNDEATIYSSWSSFETVIPQAAVTVKEKNKTTVVASWPKVANATKYIIYVCRNYSYYGSSNNFKKKTVSASTRSYKITGLSSYQTAAVYVIPVVKVNGKTYKAGAVYVNRFYTR